jgi:hypothetical protein
MDSSPIGGSIRVTSTKKTGQRHKGRPREEHVLYIVEVVGWHHYYGYSAHRESRHEDAGYRHTETVAFNGKLVHPKGFRYPNAEVTLSAHDESTTFPPEGFRAVIGTLDAAGDTLRAYAFVPRDHMAQLVAVAASGRVRVALFHGTPLKRRSGTIWSVSVSTSDEELADVGAS